MKVSELIVKNPALKPVVVDIMTSESIALVDAIHKQVLSFIGVGNSLIIFIGEEDTEN